MHFPTSPLRGKPPDHWLFLNLSSSAGKPGCNIFAYCAADASVNCAVGSAPPVASGTCQLKFQSALKTACDQPEAVSKTTNFASGAHHRSTSISIITLPEVVCDKRWEGLRSINIRNCNAAGIERLARPIMGCLALQSALLSPKAKFADLAMSTMQELTLHRRSATQVFSARYEIDIAHLIFAAHGKAQLPRRMC